MSKEMPQLASMLLKPEQPFAKLGKLFWGLTQTFVLWKLDRVFIESGPLCFMTVWMGVKIPRINFLPFLKFLIQIWAPVNLFSAQMSSRILTNMVHGWWVGQQESSPPYLAGQFSMLFSCSSMQWPLGSRASYRLPWWWGGMRSSW